jgi:hypothetical protein
MRYVGWIRLLPSDPQLSRHWQPATKPLRSREACWHELEALAQGDGGKVVLAEGEQPTNPREDPFS